VTEGFRSVLVVGTGVGLSEDPLGSTAVSVETVDSPGSATVRLDAGGIDCVVLVADDASDLDFVGSVTEKFPAVPVLLVTDDDALAERAIDAGASDVIRGTLEGVPAAVVENRIRRIATTGNDRRCRSPIRDRGRILDAALDDLDDIVYVADENDELVAWNRTLPERLGYTDEEMAGMTGEEVYPDEQWEEASDGTGSRTNPDRVVRMDFLTEDGERVPHEFASKWFRDDRTGKRFRVGIAREVGHRQDYERQLRQRNDRLVEFTGKLVEELRRSIEAGYAAAAVTGHEEGVELDEVEDALDGMERVVENAVALARAGRAVLDGSGVDLGSAARSAWSEVPSKNAMLSVTDCEAEVACDPARLRRTLSELFGNSIAHGRPAAGAGDASGTTPISVQVGCLERDGGDPIGFYVEDDGVGVPPAERDLAFDPGYSTSDDGDGFGLAFVSEIATAHEWDVRLVESEEGGARFEFRGVAFVAE
jgi:PAS domain S-box-containing protein